MNQFNLEELDSKQITSNLIVKAKDAMEVLTIITRKQVDEVVQALAWAIMKPESAEELAYLSVKDTG